MGCVTGDGLESRDHSLLVAQASEATEGPAGPECPARLESPEQYCLATQRTHMEQGPCENWTCDDFAFLGRTGGGGWIVGSS